MTEVNGTSTTILLVCWLPFKAEEGKKRESKKGRVSIFVPDVRVGEPGLDLVHIEGWWRAMDEGSQSVGARSCVDNVPRWTLR